jgi:hypothetical protein
MAAAGSSPSAAASGAGESPAATPHIVLIFGEHLVEWDNLGSAAHPNWDPVEPRIPLNVLLEREEMEKVVRVCGLKLKYTEYVATSDAFPDAVAYRPRVTIFRYELHCGSEAHGCDFGPDVNPHPSLLADSRFSSHGFDHGVVVQDENGMRVTYSREKMKDIFHAAPAGDAAMNLVVLACCSSHPIGVALLGVGGAFRCHSLSSFIAKSPLWSFPFSSPCIGDHN